MIYEEVKKYRKLSADNNPDTSIGRISSYLDGYNKGLEDAWEAARRLMLSPVEGGLTVVDLNYLFSDTCFNVLATYDAADVIERLWTKRC